MAGKTKRFEGPDYVQRLPAITVFPARQDCSKLDI